MEYRFKADEWGTLTKEQQLERCRTMANEARTLAQNAPPNMREGYRALATQWLALAAEIEKAN